jgi:hypothetical protein
MIDWDNVTARLTPNPNLTEPERSRVQEVINLLGLNLDLEVRSQRSKIYEDAVRAAADQRWDYLRRSGMRHRPHSLAARTVLQTVAPERLPGVEEEMLDLADSLWSDLKSLMAEIRRLGSPQTRSTNGSSVPFVGR